MHEANKLWLNDLKKDYPKSFKKVTVLDLGSLDINGSARPWFDECMYVGVDQTKGVGVDLICKMKDTNFEYKFDVIISLNCFMHDLDWRNSLKHNLQWLKSGGMFFTSFGDVPRYYPDWTEINPPDFLDICFDCGMNVKETFYENQRYSRESLANPKTKGMFNLIAQKK